MDGLNEKLNEEIQREHEKYVRRLENKNQKLSNSIDNLLFNLSIISRLTNDEKTAAVITDIIATTRQDLTI